MRTEGCEDTCVGRAGKVPPGHPWAPDPTRPRLRNPGHGPGHRRVYTVDSFSPSRSDRTVSHSVGYFTRAVPVCRGRPGSDQFLGSKDVSLCVGLWTLDTSTHLIFPYFPPPRQPGPSSRPSAAGSPGQALHCISCRYGGRTGVYLDEGPSTFSGYPTSRLLCVDTESVLPTTGPRPSKPPAEECHGWAVGAGNGRDFRDGSFGGSGRGN